MTKKLLSLLLVLSIAFATCLSLASCGTPDGKGEDDGKDDTAAKTPESSTTFVNISINPEISLTVDGTGKVTAAIGENEDGQVLLYGEAGIEGATVEAATEKIVQLAISMGFLSEDNPDVETLVSSTDATVEQELLNKVRSKIIATAEGSGLSITVGTEGAYALMRDLEALKAANPDVDAVQALTVKDYKLALTASENGDISFEAAIALDDSELIALLSDTYTKVEDYCTDAYEAAKIKAQSVFDKAVALRLDTVYTTYYASHATAHPFTGYLGVLYQLYAMSAHSFEALAEGIALIEELENYELDPERVAEIAEPLGLSDDELYKLQDSEGGITLESVNAYVTVYLGEIAGSAEAAEIQADIEAALTAAATDVDTQVAALINEYKPMINDVVDYIQPTLAQANALLEAYSKIPGMLSEEEVTALLKAYEEGMEISNAAVSGEDLDPDKLTEAIAKMEEGRLAVLARIEADLSEDELAKIETMKAAIESSNEAERAAFEAALDSAADTAKSHLASLKSKYLAEAA